MALSDAAIDAVSHAKEHLGITTAEADWKEVVSRTFAGLNGETYELITLSHPSVPTELHAVSHEDDCEEYDIIEGDVLLYDLVEEDGELHATFSPKTYWERNGHSPTEDYSLDEATLLIAAYGLPTSIADTDTGDGMFSLPSHLDMAGAHSYFQKLGYEYRDMTSGVRPVTASAAAAAATADGYKAAAAQILIPVIDNFETKHPAGQDVFIGQDLWDEFTKFGDNDTLKDVTLKVLELAGLPGPLTSVYSAADRDEVLKRVTKAAQATASRMQAVKAASAISERDKRMKEAPADLTGKDAAEIYRLAIRGKVPQVAAVGFCFDDERVGGATEDELAWYCGYLDHNGKLMRELSIPDHVFEGWFPEYPKVTWNDYEPKDVSNYHTMPLPKEEHIEGTRAIISSRYADRGAVHAEDMLADMVTPLEIVSTSMPSGAPSHVVATSGASNIVTLKAYPKGHTGVAPPLPTSAAPAPAPTLESPIATTVDTPPDSKNLWREYQMDITALASQGISKVGYQIVDTTPHIVFAVGFLDEAGGVAEIVPQEEVLKLFSEYTINCLDDGITYRVIKMFGQSKDDFERVIRDRLRSVNIFDIAEEVS